MFSTKVTQTRNLQGEGADANWAAYLALGADNKEIFRCDIEGYLLPAVPWGYRLLVTWEDRDADEVRADAKGKPDGLFVSMSTIVDMHTPRDQLDGQLHAFYTGVADMPNKYIAALPRDSGVVPGKASISEEHAKNGGRQDLTWPLLEGVDLQEAQRAIQTYHGRDTFTFRTIRTGAFCSGAALNNDIVIDYDPVTNKVTRAPYCTNWQ